MHACGFGIFIKNLKKRKLLNWSIVFTYLLLILRYKFWLSISILIMRWNRNQFWPQTNRFSQKRNNFILQIICKTHFESVISVKVNLGLFSVVFSVHNIISNRLFYYSSAAAVISANFHFNSRQVILFKLNLLTIHTSLNIAIHENVKWFFEWKRNDHELCRSHLSIPCTSVC